MPEGTRRGEREDQSMETFEEILASYLEAFEQHPDQDVEQLIAKMAAAHGLSDEGKAMLQETNAYLDDFQRHIEEMAQAEEEGDDKETWLTNTLEQSLEDLDEERKAIVCGTLVKQIAQQTEQSLTEEEHHGNA